MSSVKNSFASVAICVSLLFFGSSMGEWVTKG